MKILTLNVGSSSVKYSLFENEKALSKGIIERIGQKITYEEAIEIIFKKLLLEKLVASLKEISVVGHRVIYGGKYSSAVLINKEVMEEISKFKDVSPLHQVPEIKGIEACMKKLKCKHVAVFDSSYYVNMPEKAKVYGLPYSYYTRGIKKIGFHGISHNYVYNEACNLLGRKGKVISCHLGNGLSITATDKGRAIDTTMGYTPLQGLIMGTRCGDIDPGIIPKIMRMDALTAEQTEDILNNKSGYLGLCGKKDFRDIKDSDDAKCRLVVEMLAYQITKYIGAYIAALNNIDAIVFTAGIGENEHILREKVISNFEFMGIKIDKEKNKKNEKDITGKGSKAKVYIIPTNEELMITKECRKLVR